MRSALIVLLSFLAAYFSRAAEDLSAAPVGTLIDMLTQIDAQAPGLHGTASVLGFIAEDKSPGFGGGILGSPAPIVPPAMRELARRGPQAIPDLIGHLNDQRPTKLTIGKDFFMFRYFSDEYDPKTRPSKPPKRPRDPFERSFDGGYTVKVGDVCYALIGQIVNRNLSPVRYQPTAGLVINSPLETPSLVERVKKDWGDLAVSSHKASLVADAKSGGDARQFGAALARLRFYYPDDYKRLKDGDLRKRITEFEADESKQH